MQRRKAFFRQPGVLLSLSLAFFLQCKCLLSEWSFILVPLSVEWEETGIFLCAKLPLRQLKFLMIEQDIVARNNLVSMVRSYIHLGI